VTPTSADSSFDSWLTRFAAPSAQQRAGIRARCGSASGRPQIFYQCGRCHHGWTDADGRNSLHEDPAKDPPEDRDHAQGPIVPKQRTPSLKSRKCRGDIFQSDRSCLPLSTVS